MRPSLLLCAPPPAALLSLALLGGCGNSNEPLKAYVAVTMSSDSNQAAGMCSAFASQAAVLTVGQAAVQTGGDPMPPVRITSGAQGVELTCSVRPMGSSFSVTLGVHQANVTGMGQVNFAVSGVVDPANGGTGITADISNPSSFGDYSSKSCTINFITPTAGAPIGPPVAGGRIWAHLSCPAAQNPDMTTSTGAPATCDAEADFIFENCGG
jgi:hypothetical protein